MTTHSSRPALVFDRTHRFALGVKRASVKHGQWGWHSLDSSFIAQPKQSHTSLPLCFVQSEMDTSSTAATRALCSSQQRCHSHHNCVQWHNYLFRQCFMQAQQSAQQPTTNTEFCSLLAMLQGLASYTLAASSQTQALQAIVKPICCKACGAFACPVVCAVFGWQGKQSITQVGCVRCSCLIANDESCAWQPPVYTAVDRSGSASNMQKQTMAV